MLSAPGDYLSLVVMTDRAFRVLGRKHDTYNRQVLFLVSSRRYHESVQTKRMSVYLKLNTPAVFEGVRSEEAIRRAETPEDVYGREVIFKRELVELIRVAIDDAEAAKDKADDSKSASLEDPLDEDEIGDKMWQIFGQNIAGRKLSKDQWKCIRSVKEEYATALSAAPGTGKSTLISALSFKRQIRYTQDVGVKPPLAPKETDLQRTARDKKQAFGDRLAAKLYRESESNPEGEDKDKPCEDGSYADMRRQWEKAKKRRRAEASSGLDAPGPGPKSRRERRKGGGNFGLRISNFLQRRTAMLLCLTHVAVNNTATKLGIDASTVHKFLMQARHNPTGFLDENKDLKLLILDESSMVSGEMLYELKCVCMFLQRFGSLERVFYLGDNNQLVCIEGFPCLQDLKYVPGVAQVYLFKNHRSSSKTGYMTELSQVMQYYANAQKRDDLVNLLNGAERQPLDTAKKAGFVRQLRQIVKRAFLDTSEESDLKFKYYSPSNIFAIKKDICDLFVNSPREDRAVITWRNKTRDWFNLLTLKRLTKKDNLRKADLYRGDLVPLQRVVLREHLCCSSDDGGHVVAWRKEILTILDIRAGGRGELYSVTFLLPGKTRGTVTVGLTAQLRRNLDTNFCSTVFSTQGTENDYVYMLLAGRESNEVISTGGMRQKKCTTMVYGHLPDRLGERTPKFCETKEDELEEIQEVLTDAMSSCNRRELTPLYMVSDPSVTLLY